MRDEFHPPLEEYLQTIESLNEEGGPVIQARIAERLGKSAASVSEMLDRLTGEGYVDRSGREIILTTQGEELARRVIRKHRLAERLLVDVLGLAWHKVHDEASRWEHVMSDEVEERLVKLLGDPGTCPHGNPIPGSSNPPTEWEQQVALADVPPGTAFRFERLTEAVELDLACLRYLDEAGFIPGTTATVQTRAPDGTLVLLLDGGTLALGGDLCRKLFVLAA